MAHFYKTRRYVRSSVYSYAAFLFVCNPKTRRDDYGRSIMGGIKHRVRWEMINGPL